MKNWTVLAVAVFGLGAVACFGMAETNVLAFGAVADDGFDDSAAFQQALDALIADGGGYLEIPAGQYRIEECLSVWVAGSFGSTSDVGRIS